MKRYERMVRNKENAAFYRSTLINSMASYLGDQLEITKSDLSKSHKILKVILGLGSNAKKILIEYRLVTDSLCTSDSFYNFFVS